MDAEGVGRPNPQNCPSGKLSRDKERTAEPSAKSPFNRQSIGMVCCNHRLIYTCQIDNCEPKVRIIGPADCALDIRSDGRPPISALSIVELPNDALAR